MDGPLAHFFFVEPGRKVGGRAPGKKELIVLLEPVLHSLGYELVDLDLRLGSNGLLRLFIDRDPPITLTDCELVSEQIGAWLDVEDPLPGSYVLEVSSPGADRRLRTLAHFERFVGAQIKVELSLPRDGRRRFQGELTGVTDDGIRLSVDGDLHIFRLAEVANARLVPDA